MKKESTLAPAGPTHRFCVSLLENLCKRHQLALQVDTGKQVITIPAGYDENILQEDIARSLDFFLRQLRRFGYEVIGRD